MGIAAFALFAAMAALVALVWNVVPHPREHALGATTAALLVYVAVHAGIGLLFLLSNLMRLASGFVSRRRLLDLRLTRLWIDYTAVTGALVIGLVLALPTLVGVLGMRP
jgi:cytochrome c oxidase subunit I+III